MVPVRKIRVAAYAAMVAALCVGAAPAASAQVSHTNTRSTSAVRLDVSVDAQLNSASFSVRSDPSAAVSVATGTDSTNLFPKNDPVKRAMHEITISPLAPDTLYFYRVRSVSPKGVVTSKTGRFMTGQMQRPTLSMSESGYLLNGVRTFPIMALAFDECPSQQVVSDDAVMGVQYLYHNTWYGCTPNDPNQSLTWLTADALHALLGGQMGWIQDGPRRGYNPPEAPPLPSWDNLQQLVSLQGTLNTIPATPELVSCSTAPLVQFYQRPKGAAQNGPALFQIRVTSTYGPNTNCLTAQKAAPVIWGPLMAGADGELLVTQLDSGTSVSVNSNSQVALGAQAKHLAALYPCLFGGTSYTASSNNADVKVIARKWGGGTCVVALNFGDQPETVGLKLPTGSVTAKVEWENRSVAAKSGTLTDRFAPYQLHVYYFPGS